MAKKADQRDQRRDAALSALLESNSFTEAAERARISRRTLYEYLHNDLEFAREYFQMRNQQKIAFGDALTAHREHALETIAHLMDDQETPPAIRLKAAQVVLEAGTGQDEIISAIEKANINRNDNPLGLLTFGEP